MLGKVWFIPVKVKDSSDRVYIEYDSDGDAFSKNFSFKDYLDEVRQHVTNMIRTLIYRSSWKINFILGLYYLHEKDDVVTEK